jgi:hypothetical protein
MERTGWWPARQRTIDRPAILLRVVSLSNHDRKGLASRSQTSDIVSK